MFNSDIDIVDSWFSNSNETEAIHPTTERSLGRSDGDSVGLRYGMDMHNHCDRSFMSIP
jgi:hypothetical protein